jgi:hypothetical protein
MVLLECPERELRVEACHDLTAAAVGVGVRKVRTAAVKQCR